MARISNKKKKYQLKYDLQTNGMGSKNRKRREFRKKHILKDLALDMSLENISKKHKINLSYCRQILRELAPVEYSKRVKKLRRARIEKARNKKRNLKKKYCNNCKKTKLKKEFHEDNSTITGVRVFCRVCANKKREEYRTKNKKKIRAYQKAYMKKYNKLYKLRHKAKK